MGTKRNPGKFDCHAAANFDEPLFTLAGRDPLAGALIRMWHYVRSRNPSVFNDAPDKLAEALRSADEADKWCVSLDKVPVGQILPLIDEADLKAELERRGATVIM